MAPKTGDKTGAVDDRVQGGDSQATNLSDWAVAAAYGSPETRARANGDRTMERVNERKPATNPENGTVDLLDGSKVRFENGRAAAITTARGETTTVHYASAEKNAKIDSYQVTDKKGQVLETAKLEANGIWSLDGKQDWKIVDVKFGSRYSLEMTDKDNVVHARTLSGNAIRIDNRLPEQVLKDGRHVPAVTAELTADRRRSDFEYSTVNGPDGKPMSRLDNYTVKDADGHIMKFGIRRPDGKWLQFEAQEGEKDGLPGKTVDRIKQLMHDNPQQLLKEKPLADHVVVDPYRKAQNVEIIADGRRIDVHENGSKTWEAPNGASRLVYMRSASDTRGTREESIDYDHSGKPIRLNERLHANGRTIDSSLTRQADGWYDETGKKRDINIEANKDGSVTIRMGVDRVRQLNTDGSEVILAPNKGGDLVPIRLIDPAGKDVDLQQMMQQQQQQQQRRPPQDVGPPNGGYQPNRRPSPDQFKK